MIGRIHGVLLEKTAPDLLVDVQGVGYQVQVSMTTFFGLPDMGETITLHTHFVVREDAQQLYGFGSRGERELFRSLIKVNGVGPKVALAILSGMTGDEFIRSVQAEDVATLVRLPGVGRKTAERLLVEMRDKVAGLSTGQSLSTMVAVPATDSAAEAQAALVALGYKPQEAARMVATVNSGQESQDTTELIRMALKSVVKK